MTSKPAMPGLTSDSTELPKSVPLRAGPLSLLFHDGDLRRVKWGDREVIRRIYGAVRDRNWGTIPGTVTGLEVASTDSTFRIRYIREHMEQAIHFVWQAEIVGEDDGTIRFRFDGEAKSTFLRNRIGLCVLHPIRECAGARCRTLHADGTSQEFAFPERVAVEQPIDGFSNLAGLFHEVTRGLWLECTFDGDLFETEDQRNWIDASFKTYSTPVRLRFPVEIQAGTRIHQAVTLRLAGNTTSRRNGEIADSNKHGPFSSEISPTRIRVAGSAFATPAIGLGASSIKSPDNFPSKAWFAPLSLSHLRHDVRLGANDWERELLCAFLEASTLGLPLELAVHLERLPTERLPELVGWLNGAGARSVSDGRLARLLVFQDGQKSTTADALRAIRAAFAGHGIPIGAGTDADLYQLHIQPPPSDSDFICWSMNPQVHASDNLSIAETPEAVAHQLVSVRHRYPGLPLIVSPITLKPRFNPVATGSEFSLADSELPPQVDVRQTSLFCAAWTVAMYKVLAEGRATSVTFFETTGWRGVMETAAGSPLPDRFPSRPGCVFPVYHVLADIGELARGTVEPTETDDPLNVASVLLHAGNLRRLLVANLCTETRRVLLPDISSSAFIRLLDATTAPRALHQPEQFRAQRTVLRGTEFPLTAYAIATLDFIED